MWTSFNLTVVSHSKKRSFKSLIKRFVILDDFVSGRKQRWSGGPKIETLDDLGAKDFR